MEVMRVQPDQNKTSWSRYLFIVTLVLLSIIANPLYAAPGDISTVAGNGVPDGELATNAPMMARGVAIDKLGNIYIAASFTSRVYRVDKNGLISTVAGNGAYGYSGDGGAANKASLSIAEGVAVDSTGNLYIADTGNNRIRKVDVNGIITTVAGDGTAGSSGDGGPASSASLNYPRGLAIDSGDNLFFTDSYNNRVRKVDVNGIITAVAGNGTAGFSGDGGPASSASLYRPWGIALDDGGSIYVADTFNARVRKIDTSGVITTVAGNGESGWSSGDGGLATSAVVPSPVGVAVDTVGSLFISSINARVRKVDVNGIISTVANVYDGLAQTAGLATDSADNIYIADSGFGKSHVRMLATNGVVTIVAGNGEYGFYGDGGPAYNANLYRPTNVTQSNAGNLFIVDSENHRIRKMDERGVISTVAGNGGIGYSGDGVAAVDTTLYYPADVAIDSVGNLYISDDNNHRIRKVDTNGIISTVAGNGNFGYSGDGGLAIDAAISQPQGIIVDNSGNIFFADYSNHCIRKVDVNGIITTVAGNGIFGYSGDGGPAINASLKYPSDIEVDDAGILYIADTYSNRIRKVDANGIITSLSISGLNFPTDIVIDKNGDLYIAERLGHRIRKISQNGTVITVAGTGKYGYSDDDRLATSASLNHPTGIAVGAAGNLYIADTNNNRIRRVEGPDVAAPGGSIEVNGGYGYVNTTAVTLSLNCNDNVACTEMLFSNDGVTLGVWMPYAASAQWLLEAGDGPKTVYVKYRDAAGNESDFYSDSIILDSTAPKAVAASSVDSYHVDVTFDETVIGAELAGNYVADKGLTISAATVLSGNTYRLTTSHQEYGVSYTITASGISDRAGNSVSADANSVVFSRNSNVAPIITSTPATAVVRKTAYSYTLTAVDSDADTLTLSAPVLPGWLGFDAASGVLSGTPTKNEVGDFVVTLQVSDGVTSVTQNFTITVTRK